MKTFNKNAINIYRPGINSVHRATKLQFAGDLKNFPVNSKCHVSPWSHSSIEQDIHNTPNSEKLAIVNELEKKFHEQCAMRGLSTNNFINKTDDFVVFSSILGKPCTDAIEFLKSTTIDVNIKDYWGNNVLTVLCLKCEIDTLLAILENCSNNFSQNTLYDFLIYMVSTLYPPVTDSQRSDILKALFWILDDDIFNKQDEFGNTIIMHALGNPNMLQELLKNKEIDLSISNLCGNNPVSYCVQSGYDDSLKLLISYMKDNYTKDKSREILNHKNFVLQSPLMIAVESMSVNSVKFLLHTKLIDINDTNYEGKTALLYSIEHDLTEITELLLATKDININFADSYGNTPIVRSIESGNHKLILSLLSKMAELNIVDSIGRSPLLHALMLKYSSPKLISARSHNDFVPFDHGFVGGTYAEFSSCFKDPDFIGNNGPEMFAKKNKIDVTNKSNSSLYDVIVSKLIQSDNADINMSDIQGQTPMMLICNNEDVFLFNMLISNNKYDPHKKNVKGISDYQYIKNNYETMVCSLFGSNGYCPLKCCKLHGKYDKEKIKEEAKLIKDVAKEINSLSEDSDSDGSIESDFSTEDEINFSAQNIEKSFKLDDPVDNFLPKPEYASRKTCDSLVGNMLEIRRPDIGFCNEIALNQSSHINEIEIKKFSVLKFFYEKMEKLVVNKEQVSTNKN